MLHELGVAADPQRWAALGFAITGGAAVVGGVRLRLRGGDGGVIGWALEGLSATALDGLPTTRAAGPRPPVGPAHPNGAVAVDHVVALTPDLPRTEAALATAGMQARGRREAGALTQVFYVLGPCVLELAHGPEVSAGPARFWGLTLVVGDLDQVAERLGEALGPVRDAVQPGRRIATVRRAAGLGVPVALMTPRASRGA